jgi:cell division protein FtsA
VVEGVFSVPVRLGVPMKIGGLKDVVKNPGFSTGVGLVIYGSKHSGTPLGDIENGLFARLLKRMKQWFKDVI